MSQSNDYCTVYLLKNLINSKVYIGQTWLQFHIRMGKFGENYSNSPYIYNAIKKHGVENFKYEELARTDNQETANRLEEEFMVQYDSRNQEIGYNLKTGGSNGLHSEETIAKIRNTMLNKEWSPEAIEAKKAGGRARKGQIDGPHTDEWKEETSEFMKKWHANNEHPMLGKHQSDESKELISKKNTGRKLDPNMVKERSKQIMMSAEREQEIIASYQSGDTFRVMSEKFKTNANTINRVLLRNNISKTRTTSSSRIGTKDSEEAKNNKSIARQKFWDEKKKK